MTDQSDFFHRSRMGEEDTGPLLSRADRLERLKCAAELVSKCTACKLHTTRTQTVYGEGNPEAEVMFVGEGPGRVEDETGRPFVGPAGELLTRIIENGMGVKRSQVYIANVTKCRPTVDLRFEKDRPPEADEVAACAPFLLEQIGIIRPRVIVSLGNPSTKFLLNTGRGITSLRGQWHEFRGTPLMPMYHPSYVLRQSRHDNGRAKREAWSDVKAVLARLGWPLPVRNQSAG